jgi:Uma2 family endonuclease
MITMPLDLCFSPDEYLQIEERSPIKHEYVDGQLYAMVGTSQDHNRIAINLILALSRYLDDSSCRVFISDVKVRLEERNRFFYPDVAVSCDDRDRETPLYLRFPSLIVEVLSDSTEAYDRGDKFQDYQTLESLQEYVLISSKRQLVECFRRSDEGLWIPQSYTQEQQTYQIVSIGFSSTLQELYRNVSF